MFPKTMTNEDETQVNIENPTVTKNAPSRKRKITLLLVLLVVIGAVVAVIVLKTRGETGWCGTVDYVDDGIAHSIDVYMYPNHHVEILEFEKIANVSDGGTLVFDFNKRLVSAYSAVNRACYLWADDDLDWQDRYSLYNGHSPSFYVERKDIIPSGFLKSVAVDEIVDRCFNMTTYWSIRMMESNRDADSLQPSRNRRKVQLRCLFTFEVFGCP